jgi:hypothetical protein
MLVSQIRFAFLGSLETDSFRRRKALSTENFHMHEGKKNSIHSIRTIGPHRYTTGQRFLLKSILVLMLVTIIFHQPGSFAQNASVERQVTLEPLNKYAPVKILSIGDKGKNYPNPFGAPQIISLEDDNGDWIHNLSVVILNQSPKHISAVEIQLDVPEWQDADWKTNHNGNFKFIFFYLGQLPQHAPTYGNEKRDDEESQTTVDIPPGSVSRLPLTSGFKRLKEYRQRTSPVELVNGVWVRIRRIFFDDGTMWAFNAYLKPDNSTPNGYVQISVSEFYSESKDK